MGKITITKVTVVTEEHLKKQKAFKDKEPTLSDVFKEEFYINESVIQEQVSKGEGIEFSMSGDLIPVEIVETAIRDFVKKIRTGIDEIRSKVGKSILDDYEKLINKHAGGKFK